MTSPTYLMYLRKSSESEERQELSIPAQERELQDLARRRGLSFVGEPYREARTAKVPGRPLFGEVMEAIRAGKASGIVCWKLDRLARNPLDGGTIMWALGEGVIREIVTPDRTYTGTGDDKLLMSIMFGMATKYSDDLSDNIRRGQRQALEVGRWPYARKLGYVRDPRTLELVPDPERFAAVQQIWKRVLDRESPLDVLRAMNEDLGLRTPLRPGGGGKPVAKGRLYRILHDPFYAGVMQAGDRRYTGNHRPMVTLEEFERVQDLISGRATCPSARPKHLSFAYRGLIRCGACGALVTAEYTTNRYGTRYTYYHCCRKERRYQYCPERSLEERQLEEQIATFLSGLVLPPRWVERLLPMLEEYVAETDNDRADAQRRIDDEMVRVDRRLVRLRELCVDGVLSEAEYVADRDALALERQKLVQQRDRPQEPTDVELFRDAISFVDRAVSGFQNGTPDERRSLTREVTSNLYLRDRKLLIEAKKPFALLREWPRFPSVCRFWNHVRTSLQVDVR